MASRYDYESVCAHSVKGGILGNQFDGPALLRCHRPCCRFWLTHTFYVQILLNLIKQKERHARELVLGKELANATSVLNSQVPPEQRVHYVAWDFSAVAKKNAERLLPELTPVLEACLMATGALSCLSRVKYTVVYSKDH